jgi:type II secretory pathway pseudopilin PulG
MHRSSSRVAFTLVELLTVIAIIILLIGILVPAVNAVRKNARNTATQGTLASVGTAIDTFRADQRVGGSYPPSVSDADDKTITSPGAYEVANPYQKQGIAGNTIEITGAGLLLWALAGADLLGTPGFRPFRTSGSTPSTFWCQDTDAKYDSDPTKRGAYALEPPPALRPLQARSGPYIDLGKVRVSAFNNNTKSFDIEAEVKARESAGKPAVKRDYPMLLDGFGFPLLYWRADQAGVWLADDWKVGTNVKANRRGIYHYQENAPLISDRASKPLILRSSNASKPHPLFYDPAPIEINLNDPGSMETKGFWEYIRSYDVRAKVAPQNPDSYLLISAGEDGLYGSADDIANFKHNGK